MRKEKEKEALLKILSDGRWRTSEELSEHPKMKQYRMTAAEVGTTLGHLKKLGLVECEVMRGWTIRMWRVRG